MRASVVALLVVASGGCGGYHGSGGISIGIDAPGAALVVLQDGDQPFRQVQLDAVGSAVETVREGFYAVGVFCPTNVPSKRRSTRFLYDTEARVVFAPCTFSDAPFVRISGMTDPGAEVSVGQLPAFVDETGAYEGSVLLQDEVDAIALLPGATPRMLIARFDGTRDRVVDLPVATNGVDLVEVTPAVTNAFGEVSLSADINTPSTFAFLGTGTTTIHIPPASALDEEDHVTIAASAGNCFSQSPPLVAGLPPELRIPSPLVMHLERAQVAWTADPDVVWENANLRFVWGSNRDSLNINVAPSWRTVSGSGDSFPIVDVPTEIPGWTADLAGFTTGELVEGSFRMGRGDFDGTLHSCTEQFELVW